MKNLKKNICILVSFYVLATISTASCATQSIIYVSGDGTGNYSCDGTNDEVQINQALQYAASHPGTTVYLKGPFVYDIKSSCLIGSNTELTGDSSSKLRLSDNVGWTTAGSGTPILGQLGGAGTVVHDIKIHGFEIDGNEGAQSGSGGVDLYRIISFQGNSGASVYNISVYDMNLHDAKGEGFRCTFGKNINYFNNIGSNLQHTCVMYKCVDGGLIYGNEAYTCSCGGDRFDNCQNIIIENEYIYPYKGVTTYSKNSMGFTYSDKGIQIANSLSSPLTSNITIRNCDIRGGVNGILLEFLNDGSNVNIYSNVIRDSGYENEGVTRNGGIGLYQCGNGITIQNNDIIGWDVAGINVDSARTGTTRIVTVKNNNIVSGDSGYAVKNSVLSNVSLILTHNYMWNNIPIFYPSSLNDTDPATSPNQNVLNGTSLVQPVLPIANFSSNVTSGYAPLSVKFTSTSTNTTSWNWNFGDGTSSTLESPSHLYSKAGNYTVNLTVKNENGTDSEVAKVTVLLKPVLPVANFQSNVTSGYAPLSVKFTSTSTNSTSWNWNFGDGTSSTLQSPAHTYSSTGNYTVNLTVRNANGSASKIGNITVLLKTAQPKSVLPVANFQSNVTSGYAPLSVKFTSTSQNATKWYWNFGDGTNSTLQNPVHLYSKSGNYTINLTVSNTNGSASKINKITVLLKTVQSKPVLPVANFTSNVTKGYAPFSVKFTDKSTGTPTSWYWSFGDSSYSTLQNPTHKYSSAGKYTVSLTATNSLGFNTTKKYNYIVVNT